ncbi:MAG: hypothetical protein IVW57_01175 [Ktedonobacterales bacterium]|nr:hypothetical protein [Ktedonobacterales bacterium]
MVRERAERGGEAPAMLPHNPLSIAEVRQLITLMNMSDLEEITIEQESTGLRLTLRKPPAPVVDPRLPFAEVEAGELIESPAEPPPAEQGGPRGTEVRAPLVGIFRASLKTDGQPLVSLGDTVREGQVVGAIEALNVLNEVETRMPGKVRTVLVSDGQAVEYGQPLLLIEAPDA